VRALADALVVALDMHGKSKSDLASSLALFPNVQRLEADCHWHSADVISAAPLAKLRALVLSHSVSHARMGRSAPCGGGQSCHACAAHGWQLLARVPCSTPRTPSQTMQRDDSPCLFAPCDQGWEAGSVPALSPTAAAGIQELHLYSHYPYPILSIEALRGCAQLRMLSLERCKVSDLGPLAGCVHLEELSTSVEVGSDFSDLAPLGGCVKLKKLWIAHSQMSDLAPLRGCVELKDISISNCYRLSSLEGLQACRQLERLNMPYCQLVTSLAPLSACAHLKMVNMRGTSVTSVEPLMACTQLEELRIAGLTRLPSGMASLKATLPQLLVIELVGM
jgi:Leucine-rich repeat (LRR) protein